MRRVACIIFVHALAHSHFAEAKDGDGDYSDGADYHTSRSGLRIARHHDFAQRMCPEQSGDTAAASQGCNNECSGGDSDECFQVCCRTRLGDPDQERGEQRSEDEHKGVSRDWREIERAQREEEREEEKEENSPTWFPTLSPTSSPTKGPTEWHPVYSWDSNSGYIPSVEYEAARRIFTDHCPGKLTELPVLVKKYGSASNLARHAMFECSQIDPTTAPTAQPTPHPPTPAPPSPTKEPTPASPSTPLPTHQPSPAPTPSPTKPTTSPTTSPTVSPTVMFRNPLFKQLPQSCKAVFMRATYLCSDLKSKAYECVNQCEARVHRDEDVGPALHACPNKWGKLASELICWPSDCTGVMDFLCGDSRNVAVMGWDRRFGPQHVNFYNKCDACVNYYTFERQPPIKDAECWRRHFHQGYCKPTARWQGLPEGDEDYVKVKQFGARTELSTPIRWRFMLRLADSQLHPKKQTAYDQYANHLKDHFLGKKVDEHARMRGAANHVPIPQDNTIQQDSPRDADDDTRSFSLGGGNR